MARRSRPSKKVMFSSKLALHAYMLGLFGADTLQQLGNHLKDPSRDGRTEDGVSRFHHASVALLPKPPQGHHRAATALTLTHSSSRREQAATNDLWRILPSYGFTFFNSAIRSLPRLATSAALAGIAANSC